MMHACAEPVPITTECGIVQFASSNVQYIRRHTYYEDRSKRWPLLVAEDWLGEAFDKDEDAGHADTDRQHDDDQVLLKLRLEPKQPKMRVINLYVIVETDDTRLMRCQWIKKLQGVV